MQLDLSNVYSGTYPLGGGVSGPLAGQAFTSGTTLSTNAIDHNPAQTPFGANQNVQAGLGEPQAIFVQVTVAPVATTGNETYTLNLLTDVNSNLTTSAVTLGTLTIPRTATVGTTYVTVIPPALNFERYSGLQLVTGGNADAAISLFAALLPVNAIQNWAVSGYQSGFVIQNS